MPLGQRFNRRTGIEAIVYVAIAFKDPTFHRISKILYFADKYHLTHYGALICGDHYLAMKHGPVPSGIYDILKTVRDGSTDSAAGQAFVILSGKHVRPRRDVNLDYLSEAAREALDSAIAEYGSLAPNELTQASRDSAWEAADENEWMDILEIARTTPNSQTLAGHLLESSYGKNPP